MPYESTLLESLRGTLIRGGTSRGLFVREGVLPEDEPERSNIILELFGSPDPLQLDGIGGSHSHTSKLMIVGESEATDIDLRYTFAQVGIEEPSVNFDGNCGNLTSAIGLYGILEGLVDAEEPNTEIQLYNTNTDTNITQTIPITNGEPTVEGDYDIDGVPVKGARIDSQFHEPGGGVTGSLLPTGNVRDNFDVYGETIPASIVDAANPNVFVQASDLGLSGTELPADIASDERLLDKLELIRSIAAARLGFVDEPSEATEESPGIPYIAIVSESQTYQCTTNKRVNSDEIDITARIMSNQSPHHAYAMTGAMCLAAATSIPGTIPAKVTSHDPKEGRVRIGHPKGTVTIGVESQDDGSETDIEWVSVGRHARLLMDGVIYHRPRDGGGRRETFD